MMLLVEMNLNKTNTIKVSYKIAIIEVVMIKMFNNFEKKNSFFESEKKIFFRK